MSEAAGAGTDRLEQRPSRGELAVRDAGQAIAGWRLWVSLGSNDIAQRYRRSKLGQFWITLSMAVFVATVGSIYAVLFGTPLRDQIPHVVVFFTAWSFMAQSVNEGATAFTDAERYLRQERLPKLSFVFRVIWRNLLAYLHNLVLVPLTFVMFIVPVTPVAVEALAGLGLMLINVTLVVLIVSVLCTRFRDLRQVLGSLVQMAFFASPVMWRTDILPHETRWIVNFNPVAAHLRLIGEPLLGAPAPVHVLYMCFGTTVILLVIALPLFVRFRERVVYWL
jgi:lipopolysaccharide transport system permease protein